MHLKLLVPGLALSLIGIALVGNLSFSGPTFPTTLPGLLGWGLFLAGLAGMRLGLGVGR